MKAWGQSNFKHVYKAFLDCWLFRFQTPGSQRSRSHLFLSTHTFFCSPPNKSASKWLRQGQGEKKERERRGLKWCPLALVFTCHTYASKSHSSPRQCYIVLVKAVCTSASQHRELGSSWNSASAAQFRLWVMGTLVLSQFHRSYHQLGEFRKHTHKLQGKINLKPRSQDSSL